MRRSIDLNVAAKSIDAETFAHAVRNGKGAGIGTERFTASGDAKVPAPVRPTLTSDDFKASGTGKSE